MRKTIAALSLAAVTAAAIAIPTMSNAEPAYGRGMNYNYSAPVAGAVVGTAVGVGLYNGWYGSAFSGTVLTTTVGGAIAAGGIAGVGTVAGIDAVTQPCRGWHALLGANKGACADGEYVGYGPRRYVR